MKKFKINIFETTIHVLTDENKYKEICDKNNINYSIGSSYGHCLSTIKKDKRHIYVAMFCDKDDILVHECTHASLFILRDIGEQLNEDSELHPYLIQTLFRECKKRL